MVFVSDAKVRDLYPLLLHVNRASPAESWSFVHSEPMFAEEVGVPIFEEVRAESVASRASHLANKVEKPMSRFEAMMRTGTEIETMRAELARIREWHQKTARSWPLAPPL